MKFGTYADSFSMLPKLSGKKRWRTLTLNINDEPLALYSYFPVESWNKKIAQNFPITFAVNTFILQRTKIGK